jgi:uroporphyrinogen decarboxylase
MMTRIAGAGLDILRLGDDVGMQHAMMMSPAMWAKWLKPRLAKVIEAAKTANPSIIVSYHSDGMIMPVIEGLIEAGVDVLNPVQPECIDPAEVKAMFGDRLAFSGTIGTQTTMPFGTPDDVRRDVKDRIETVGKGGGLFIGPSHTMEPEVPWANVVAFVEAVEEYGRY